MPPPISPTCAACGAELWAPAAQPLGCRVCHNLHDRAVQTLCIRCLVEHQLEVHGQPSEDLIKYLRGLAAACDGFVSIRARDLLRSLGVEGA